MKTIGLVGGVASGKSLASKMLVELGAVLLDADRTGHAVLVEDPEVREAIVQRWGKGLLGRDGTVDRSQIAARVFGDTPAAAAERKFLESVLHPRIRRRLLAERDAAATAGKPAVILDAPLLLEAGWGPMCDHILMIDSPREARFERARSRGWSETEFHRREAAQWPVDEKRRHATLIIPNTGSEADLRAAVQSFWRKNIEA